MSKLLIVHSLYEYKLHKAINIGGFPLPSIAVIKEDNEFSRFGKITFILKPESVNPKDKKNLFFDRDIFSQRFPDAEYTTDKKAFRKLLKEIDDYSVKKGKEYYPLISIHESYTIENKSYDYANSKLLSDHITKLMYLEEKGIEVEVPYKSDSFESDLSNYKELNSYLKSKASLQDVYTDPKFKTLLLEAAESQLSEYKSLLGETIATDIYKDTVKGFFDREGNISSYSSEVSKVMRDSRKDNHLKLIIDHSQFKINIDQEIFKNHANYQSWINKKLSTVYINPHLKIGSKKFEYTLENIEKFMLKQDVKSIEDVNATNIGMISSRHAKKLKSFEDMFDNIDLLKTNDDREEHRESIRKTIASIQENIQHAYKDKDYFEMSNDLHTSLSYISDVESARRVLDKQYFDSSLIKEEDLKDIVSVALEIRNLVGHYFEGKPQKTLTFDDFEAIIIPNSIDPELVKMLPSSLKKHYYDDKSDNVGAQQRIDIFKQYGFTPIKPKKTLKIS